MARLTDAQRADRRNYLGASDIAALAGVSPFKKPFELYLEKIGELDPEAQSTGAQRDRMERGHRLEDVALDWDAEIRGLTIERVRRDIRHPRMPFVVVHPDGRVKPWRQTRRLLEAKTSARKWDVVPQHVEAQVQAQMAATGADAVDVVVLGFDGPPVPFEVVRNNELIAALEDLAASFWDRVQRRDPPPVDGSRAASHYLDRMFLEGAEVRADADQARVLARLIDIRASVKALEAEDDELVNLLKFSLAGAPRMFAPGVGKVLWTAPSERRTTKWTEVAAAFGAAIDGLVRRHPELQTELDVMGVADPETVIAEHTATTAVRTFRVTASKAD